jgi:hypothetical protein
MTSSGHISPTTISAEPSGDDTTQYANVTMQRRSDKYRVQQGKIAQCINYNDLESTAESKMSNAMPMPV